MTARLSHQPHFAAGSAIRSSIDARSLRAAPQRPGDNLDALHAAAAWSGDNLCALRAAAAWLGDDPIVAARSKNRLRPDSIRAARSQLSLGDQPRRAARNEIRSCVDNGNAARSALRLRRNQETLPAARHGYALTAERFPQRPKVVSRSVSAARVAEAPSFDLFFFEQARRRAANARKSGKSLSAPQGIARTQRPSGAFGFS